MRVAPVSGSDDLGDRRGSASRQSMDPEGEFMATASRPVPAAREKGPSESAPSRVIIENVKPEIDRGQFPIKRVIGEEVVVEADIFAEGHDVLKALLKYRPVGSAEWAEVPMSPLGNDRWSGSFTVEKQGRLEYTIEGWVDRFATWFHELGKKAEAGQDVQSELLEGAELIRQAAARALGP